MNIEYGREDAAIHESIERVVHATATLLEVPLVLLSVLEGSRQEIRGAFGLAPHNVLASELCTLCRDVAVSGRPIVLQDASTRLPPAARHGWGRELVAYAGVPLALNGSRMGTLAAFSPGRRSWQSRDLLALRTFAEAAGAILDVHARYDELRSQLDFDLDPLITGPTGGSHAARG